MRAPALGELSGLRERPTGALMVEQHGCEVVNRGFDLGNVDQLPLPGAVAMMEGCAERGLSEARRDEVGIGTPGRDGLAIGPAGDSGESAERGAMDAEARMLALGAGLPAHAAVEHHDVRLDLAQLLVAEPESFSGARREVLDHDVRPLDHAMGDGETLGLREVDRDPEFALIHVGGDVTGRCARVANPGRNESERVDARLGLDSKHGRTEVRQILGDQGTGGDP